MTSFDWIAKGDFVYRSKKPPVFVKSYETYLEDNEGKTYFDAEAANGAALLGYDSRLLETAVDKIRKMPSLPSFAESELRLRVAEKIGKMIFKATGVKGKVAFEIGGAQAMELAVKVAKKTTGKSQLIVFQGGYHGRSGYTSQLSASHRYRRILGDWRVPVTRLPIPDYENSGFPASKKKWIAWYLSEVDKLLHNEIGGIADSAEGHDVAALIIEPVLNVCGMVLPDTELLEGIVKRFQKIGALVILDEIFTGFYRTGKPFGFCRYDIQPDIIVASKGLTNGQVPIGMVWARSPLFDETHFPPGTHSATFINNAMALAVADTVLDHYADWKTIERDVKLLEKSLSAAIRRVCTPSSIFKDGYALGGLGRLRLKKPIAAEVRKTALSLPVGLMLASTGMTPDIINIHPPLNLTSAQRTEFSDLLWSLHSKYESK